MHFVLKLWKFLILLKLNTQYNPQVQFMSRQSSTNEFLQRSVLMKVDVSRDPVVSRCEI